MNIFHLDDTINNGNWLTESTKSKCEYDDDDDGKKEKRLQCERKKTSSPTHLIIGIVSRYKCLSLVKFVSIYFLLILRLKYTINQNVHDIPDYLVLLSNIFRVYSTNAQMFLFSRDRLFVLFSYFVTTKQNSVCIFSLAFRLVFWFRLFVHVPMNGLCWRYWLYFLFQFLLYYFFVRYLCLFLSNILIYVVFYAFDYSH